MSLERRLSRLESREKRPGAKASPSATELEAQRLLYEIRRLELEVEAEGGSMDTPVNWPGTPNGLSLDEEIEWLEAEIERLGEEEGRMS